jgi:hypothetical protein
MQIILHLNMFYKPHLFTFFLFSIFLFEIFFVRDLIVPFDKRLFVELQKTNEYGAPTSTQSFPIDRRKTAPEIRKYTYTFYKID